MGGVFEEGNKLLYGYLNAPNKICVPWRSLIF